MGKPDCEGQARGGLAAFERYLAGMDASMRQKVALTAAHLPCEGRVADMGMGSGHSSHALAALYPRLQVAGDLRACPKRRSRSRPRQRQDPGYDGYADLSCDRNLIHQRLDGHAEVWRPGNGL